LQFQLIEEAKTKLEQAIRKSISDFIQSPEFMAELNEKIQFENNQIKEFFLAHVQGQRDMVLEFVKEQQGNDVNEKIKAKEQLEIILEQNNKLIAQQQEKIAVLSTKSDVERKYELERFTREQEDQRQREDEARLLEVKRRVALEQQKESIINKNKKRGNFSFSLTGAEK